MRYMTLTLVLLVSIASTACTTTGEEADERDGTATTAEVVSTTSASVTSEAPAREFAGDALTVFDFRKGGGWLTIANSTAVVTGTLTEMVDELEILGRGPHQLWQVAVDATVLGDVNGSTIQVLWPAVQSGQYPDVQPLTANEQVTLALVPYVLAQGIASDTIYGVTYGEAGVYRHSADFDPEVLAMGTEVLGMDILDDLAPTATAAKALTSLIVEASPTGTERAGSFLGWDYVDIELSVNEVLSDEADWLLIEPTLRDSVTVRVSPDDAASMRAAEGSTTLWLSKAGAASADDVDTPWVLIGGSLTLASDPLESSTAARSALNDALESNRTASAAQRDLFELRIAGLPELSIDGLVVDPLTEEDLEGRYAEMREQPLIIDAGDYVVEFDTWFFTQLDDQGRVRVTDASGNPIIDDEFEAVMIWDESASTYTVVDEGGTPITEVTLAEIQAAADEVAARYTPGE